MDNTELRGRQGVQAFYNKRQNFGNRNPISANQSGIKIPQQFYQQPAPAIKQPQQSQNTRCPESVKEYIKNSFSKCTSDKERELMEKMVKDIIQYSKNQNTFYTKDWTQEKLPLLPREVHVMQNNPESSLKAAELIKNSRKQSRFQMIDFERPKMSPISPPRSPRPQKKPKLDSALEFKSKKSQPVVGTCKKLEKQFFRMTSKPDPSTVRPERILKRALSKFQAMWSQGEVKYEWFNDQLRSIRQDLTVQQIKNSFTMEVYQVHVRLAIEAGDLDQFCSCLGRVFELMRENIGSNRTVRHNQEFLAYRLLYFSLQHMFIELDKLLKFLKPQDFLSPEVQHALQFKSATIHENYHQIFQLWNTAPNMGRSLIEIFIQKVRYISLYKICKSQFLLRFLPSISVEYIQQELNFPNTAQCHEFLSAIQIVFENNLIDTKAAMTAILESEVLEKKS